MKIYIVGGAVRDELLGRTIADRDYVVVGATPQAMLEKGFRPVGKDFPVFLHPGTNEEYALARTERKTGHGYHGFAFHAAPDVTLDDDLARRDLTINAMARAADGTLVDPFHGQRDLEAGILRHVGPAFAEDPVRILRLARFAARFAEFSVAPETCRTDAQHGRQRRSRSSGCRARLAGTGKGSDGGRALAHVRGAAPVRRADAAAARDRRAVWCAAAGRLPSGNRCRACTH